MQKYILYIVIIILLLSCHKVEQDTTKINDNSAVSEPIKSSEPSKYENPVKKNTETVKKDTANESVKIIYRKVKIEDGVFTSYENDKVVVNYDLSQYRLSKFKLKLKTYYHSDDLTLYHIPNPDKQDATLPQDNGYFELPDDPIKYPYIYIYMDAALGGKLSRADSKKYPNASSIQYEFEVNQVKWPISKTGKEIKEFLSQNGYTYDIRVMWWDDNNTEFSRVVEYQKVADFTAGKYAIKGVYAPVDNPTLSIINGQWYIRKKDAMPLFESQIITKDRNAIWDIYPDSIIIWIGLIGADRETGGAVSPYDDSAKPMSIGVLIPVDVFKPE